MNKGLQIAAGLPEIKTQTPRRYKTLAQLERDYIQMILDVNNDDVSKAAKILDISPSTLYRKRTAWAKYNAD